MNAESFFKSIGENENIGPLSEHQKDGFNSILAEFAIQGLTDKRYLAYMLGTAWHETARTMQPIKEFHEGDGHVYAEIDKVTRKKYYGRGLVQITWSDNYKKMGHLLGIDLYTNPDLALQPKVAIQIMFKGMLGGHFTGKRLSDYFGSVTNDPVGARRIINGIDKAQLIAGYHYHFLEAMI